MNAVSTGDRVVDHAHHVEPHARDEDRAAVIDAEHGLVVVVVDGAGGMPGGREAADACVKFMRDRAATLVSGADIARALKELDALCDHDARAGEAAIVVAAVSATGAIVGASCGDCEAWLVHAGGDVDVLTGGQHKKRRVGSGRASPVTFSVHEASALATLVVGSDGLFGYTSRAQILACAARATCADVVGALIDAARGPPVALADDLAVIAVRLS